MRLELTQEQITALAPHMRPGQCLLARIDRELFDHTNAATSGRPFISFGPVPNASLPNLREAIREANNPKPKRKKKSFSDPTP